MTCRRLRIAALTLAFTILALPWSRATAAPPIELGQTVPVETDLAEKDVRTAKDIWVEMIDGASVSIDTAQFYVANREGSDLEPVLAALERAAKRGVKVRVLLSALKRMLEGDPASVARLRALPGGVVETLDLTQKTGGILHAKYWIVDHREVYVGSQNLDWRALSQIHELGLHLQDERIARELEAVFEHDLALAQGKEPPKTGPPAPAAARPDVELVASPAVLNPPGTRAAIDALKELFDGAKTSIAVQVLDFDTADRYSKDKNAAPWLEIDTAIRAACARGVKVRMLLSHWNTARNAVTALQALAGTANLELRICEFPRAAEGFIPYARVAHSKYMIVDGETLWIGTSNWLKDYFTATRNVELIVRKRETAGQAAAIFERLWSSKFATPFDPGRSYPAPEKGEPRKE